MKINEVYLSEFQDEMATTKKFLESISEDIFDFTPHEKSKKLIDLVNHMVAIPSWVPAFTEQSELDWSKAKSPEKLESKESILAQFNLNVTLGANALQATNDHQLDEPWKMRKEDTIFFSGKKVTAIRRYILNHIIHHRAQLGVYLRLNNVNLPGSYIASADEMLF